MIGLAILIYYSRCVRSRSSLRVSWSGGSLSDWNLHGGGGYLVGRVGCESFSRILGQPPYYISLSNWNGYIFMTKTAVDDGGTVFHVYSGDTGRVESVAVGPLISLDYNLNDRLKIKYLGSYQFEVNYTNGRLHADVIFDVSTKAIVRDNR